MVVKDNSSLCKLGKNAPFIINKELPDFNKNKFSFLAQLKEGNLILEKEKGGQTERSDRRKSFQYRVVIFV